MTLPLTQRDGRYARVCDPVWADCSDTNDARHYGGRWNPPGEFGALYLNASLRVAAANARRMHAGRAIGLFDLRPEARPVLVWFNVPPSRVVDAVSDDAIRRLRLPPSFRTGDDWQPCQAIARRAYADGVDGVASRSAVMSEVVSWRDEELALFDRVVVTLIKRLAFADWYPDSIPPPR